MIAILDIDGTLVDTNYQHAIAWYRAFRQHHVVMPIWRIHRHIGMGGDQLVPSLTSEQFDQEHGDQLRSREQEQYQALIDEVEPMDGARDLVCELRERGHRVIFASSASPEEVEHYLDLLQARDLADGWTTRADVESTKPAPDLVHAALSCAGGEADDAVMVGDSTWDIEAAKRAGVPTLAVRTGGFGAAELRDAGAADVYESVRELCGVLDRTPLR
jgi:HAD superfamily hydrolase (TIGR01509 family)